MNRVWLGLGGNVGNVKSVLATALRSLRDWDGVEVSNVSTLYKTPPWGVENQPWFLNCCAEIKTKLPPEHLLELCQEAERVGKRKRTLRWGPRTIDIDILVYEGVEQVEQRLTLPHPRMLERSFVLVPLAEIAPDLLLDGKTAQQLANNIDTKDLLLEDDNKDWWRT